MQNLQTKNRILTLFEGGNPAYERVPKEEYRQLYFAVRSDLGKCDAKLKNAIASFLYHGARAFDRFGIIRPQSVDDEQYEMFCNFLDTLQKLEGSSTNNTHLFHMDKILWDILQTCSLQQYNAEMEDELKEFEADVANVALPADEELKQLCIDKKAEVTEIINCLRNGLFKTRIHTSLPYALTNTVADFSLTVDGVKTMVKVKNSSLGSSLPNVNIAAGSTLTTSGPSKWSTTSCELHIEADCLMDALELRDNISLQKKEDACFWTAVFDFTYRVISAVWMYMQQHDDVKGTWPPLPNDFHHLGYSVSAGGKDYISEVTTNPALIYHVRPLSRPSQHYEIDEQHYDWSLYAYQFAKVYAESGQLKEAIFWLNVSVEALVEEFVQKVASTEELRQEIEGEEHKFDSAEAILVQQFPEMAGKVKWPDTVIHTSVFTKLKRAVAHTALASLKKDIIKNYQKVNAKRNALFHGGSVDITIEDVEKAFNAYGWLKDKIGKM